MAAIGTQSLSQLVRVNITQKTEFDIYKAITTPDNFFVDEKFKPLSPQLEALKTMAESAAKGGTVLLSGTFGVGKTSLLAILGRLLSINVPSEEFTSTLSLLDDVSLVKKIGELRTGNRPWLVIVPVLNKDGSDFEISVRKALQTALLDKKLDAALDPNLSLEDTCKKAVDSVRQNGYEGLLILLDEADSLIEKALKKDESAVCLEEFCTFCRQSDSSILFIAAINNEVSRLSLEEEDRAIAVFSKVQSVSILGRTGEWENFVGSSIIEHIKGELWDSLVDYKDFRSVTEGLIQSGLYKGSSEKWITDTVMHGAYPLHPAVAFSLPRVALAMSGRGRTAFNFFCDAAPGGFLYFLRNFAIVQPNGRLHLYTLDSLFTYFEKTFSADPANADYVKGLNKSVMIAGDVPQARRILRLTLIIQLIAHDRFRSTEENILWAMHLGEKETKVASHSLQLLKEKNALEFNEKTGEYALPVERRKVTLGEALARMRNRVRSQLDVCSVIRSGLAMTKIEAEDFNREYYTDRFAGVSVVLASEIDDPAKFMAEFSESLEQLRPYRGDVNFVLVAAEDKAELERVKKWADDGAFKHEQLILALLKDPVSISKDALDTLALERICTVEIPFCDPTSVEHEKAQELLNETKDRLNVSVAHVANTENLLLYHNGKVHTELDLDDTCLLVNKIISSLVGQPPMLSNGDLLSLRDGGMARRSRQSLISYILGCRGSIALRSNNRSFLNIVQSAFVETGLLESEKSEGSWHYFHLVKEQSESQAAQGYVFLCSQILGKPGSISSVDANGVIKALTRAPYGFTPSLIELLLSLAFWQYRDYLVLRKNLIKSRLANSEEVPEEVAVSAKVIFDMVSNPADWEFVFTDCTSEQLVYLQGIAELCPDIPDKDRSLWRNVGKALLAYYRELSKYSRSVGASGNEETERLRLLLEKVSSEDYPRYRPFLEEQIPALFGYSGEVDWSHAASELVSKLKENLHILASIPRECSQQICTALRAVFAPYEGGHEESSWAVCASNWYKENNAIFENDSRWKYELEALNCLVDCDDAEEALRIVLKALHYAPIEEWSSYGGYEIIERFRAMRQDIEWGSYRRSCVLSSEVAAAYGVVKSVLVSARLQDLESFLASELEWVAWPEKILNAIKETDDIADYGDLSEWTYKGGVSEKIRLARLQESEQREAENKEAVLLLFDDEVDSEDEVETLSKAAEVEDVESASQEAIDGLSSDIASSEQPEQTVESEQSEQQESASESEVAEGESVDLESKVGTELESKAAEVEELAKEVEQTDTEVVDSVKSETEVSVESEQKDAEVEARVKAKAEEAEAEAEEEIEAIATKLEAEVKVNEEAEAEVEVEKSADDSKQATSDLVEESTEQKVEETEEGQTEAIASTETTEGASEVKDESSWTEKYGFDDEALQWL